jgi:hypothetical protein
MAGFNVSGLPAFIQYQGQLQQQAQQKQQQEQNLMLFQQQQQDRQRAMATQAAVGNTLPQYLTPPPQQAPQPGQASQPMQQPAPQQAPQGQMAPPPGGGQPPPLPPGGVQGSMPPAGTPPLPPFKQMPTSPPPQQQAAPASIGAPPPQQPAPVSPQQDQMEAGFSLSNIIQKGQAQGLSGTDLYDYVKAFEPYMTAEQKQKSEQFKTQLELKKLDADISAHQYAMQNQQLSLAERMKHDDALEKAMRDRIGIQQGNLNIRIQGVGGGAAPATLDKALPNATWESDAQAIASGRMAPIPLSSRAKGAQEIMARVSAINPEYDAKDYGTQSTANKYWSTGKGGQQVNTINTAFSHVGNLQNTSKELQNGGVPAWNAFANHVANASGQPAPKDFNAQKAIVAGEVVKAIVGAGGGTREDRGEIQSLFDAANTPEQMAGVMGKVRELMSGKLEAMNRQYKKTTGKSDFADYLSPEAASYLPQGGKSTPGSSSSSVVNWNDLK